MAKLYGEIAAKALLTLDKSFARANGQPLDASEVYYSLAAAQEYAATAQAYIGQKIVVIENNVVTHYSVDDTAGNLKELGSKPVGDESTITVASNGTISLKGVGTLTFERDIIGEDGEPTGEKEDIQYQPLMTKAGLVWVEPSKTTVEGLATLIEALTARVKANEDAIAVNVKAIADEVTAARAAEEALGKRIDEIDFIDADELTSAIADAREEISAEIDADIKVAKDRADEAYTLAESKVDSTTYAADKADLEADILLAKKAGEDAQNTIDTFLNSEEIDETVNTLKEIQTELDKMADATDMVEKLALKADVSYVNEELAKKQDVIAENTYDAYGSAATAKSEAVTEAEGKIATAKQEAIDAAANAAAGIYATQTTLEELSTEVDGRLDALEAYDHATYATKEELTAHGTAADAKYATKSELSPVTQTANNAYTAVTNLETRFDEIVAVGGEPNAINKIQVNGSELSIENKTVNIAVPTKFSDITDDSGFDGRINAAQTAADNAQSTANTAVSNAAQAQNEVDALELEVGTLQTAVAGHTESISDHGTRIGVLEQADVQHATEYSELKTVVTGHTSDIAKKAEQSDLNNAIARIGANETAITTLNETTIPGINAEIAKKANASDLVNYYTKTEVGTIADGKTLVQMIADAKSEATYDDTGVKALITAEETRAKAAEDAINIELGKTNATIAALIENNDENQLNSIKELATWITEHGGKASEMAESINTNKQAIAAINNETTGILAVAKSYTDNKIAEIPTATAELLGLVKFDDTSIKMNDNDQLYIAKVSTDILEMGAQTLILNGGSATD